MQKRIVTCPKCQTQVPVENLAREVFVDVFCPRCGARMRVAFDTAETVLPRVAGKALAVPGFLSLDGKLYALKEGRQKVGRKGSSEVADICLESSDRTMSRIQCTIEAIRMKSGRWKVIIQEARSKDKAADSPLQVSGETIMPDEHIVLQDGDKIKMGETIVEYKQQKDTEK